MGVRGTGFRDQLAAQHDVRVPTNRDVAETRSWTSFSSLFERHHSIHVRTTHRGAEARSAFGSGTLTSP